MRRSNVHRYIRVPNSTRKQIGNNFRSCAIIHSPIGPFRFRQRQLQRPPSITSFFRAPFGSASNNGLPNENPDERKDGDGNDADEKDPDELKPRDTTSEGLLQLPEGTTRSVGILTGAMFFSNLGFGCVVPVLPLFATSMGLGATGVGTILSTSALARLVANIPMGRAADRIGRRPVMVGGGATVAAASVATGLANDLPMLLACRTMVGAGGSAAGAGTGAYMADITSKIPHQRAKIAGVQNTVVSVAYAVGPAVGGYLCDLYGPRNMFFIVGAANAVCTLGYFLLPESSSSASRATTTTSSGGTQDETDGIWAVYRELLQDPDRQGLMAMNFGTFCSYSALLTVFPLHAAAVLGDDGTASTIGLLFAAASTIGFAGAPLGGYLADRFGRKRTVVPAAGLICAGAVLTAAVSPENASLHALFPPILVWGLGNSMVNPGMTAFAADIARDERTRSQALALSSSAADLSFLICPISLGALAQCTDCPTALVATAGVIGVLNLAFALRTTEPKRAKEGGGTPS